MAIYRTGTFLCVSTTASLAAINLNLGFIPSEFICMDITLAATSGSGQEAYWNTALGALSTPASLLTVWSGGTPTRTTLTSTGISTFLSTDTNLFLPQQTPYTTNQSTNLTVTGISQAANAVVTATHSFTTSDIGITQVTFHGNMGMIQINNLTGTITAVTGSTTFAVNINSTNFTAWASGGTPIANVITGAPVTTQYGNQILNTAEGNLGFVGLTLGSGLFTTAAGVTANDTFWYQATLQSPATGP